jgi:MFS family permease
LNLPATAYIWQRTGAIALGSCSSIFFGYLADKVNINKLLTVLIGLTAIMAYPIYIIYAYYTDYYLIAFISSAFLTGFAAGVIPTLISDLFPTKIRYSCIAVSYNLGFAVFGGLTPFISLTLVYYTNSIIAPALYLVGVALLAIVALASIHKQRFVIMNDR